MKEHIFFSGRWPAAFFFFFFAPKSFLGFHTRIPRPTTIRNSHLSSRFSLLRTTYPDSLDHNPSLSSPPSSNLAHAVPRWNNPLESATDNTFDTNNIYALYAKYDLYGYNDDGDNHLYPHGYDDDTDDDDDDDDDDDIEDDDFEDDDFEDEGDDDGKEDNNNDDGPASFFSEDYQLEFVSCLSIGT